MLTREPHLEAPVFLSTDTENAATLHPFHQKQPHTASLQFKKHFRKFSKNRIEDLPRGLGGALPLSVEAAGQRRRKLTAVRGSIYSR